MSSGGGGGGGWGGLSCRKVEMTSLIVNRECKSDLMGKRCN